MSDSNRFNRTEVFLICALLIGVFAYVAYEVGNKVGIQNAQAISESENRAKYRKETYEYIERECINGESLDVKSCTIEAIEASKEDERGESDLNAQRNMAEYAWRMYAVSLMATIVTLAMTYLVWKTLMATRDTLKEAKKTTEAAQKTNADTWEIGTKQVRAYLSIEAAEITFTDKTCLANIEIKNIGQSPTRGITLKSSVSFADNSSGNFTSSHTDISENQATDAAVGKVGRGIGKWLVGDSEDVWKGGMSKPEKITLDVTAIWVDVFRGKQEAIFQLFYRKDRPHEKTDKGLLIYMGQSVWMNEPDSQQR